MADSITRIKEGAILYCLAPLGFLWYLSNVLAAAMGWAKWRGADAEDPDAEDPDAAESQPVDLQGGS